MIQLARLTAPEAARLARDPKAVVFLPLGAIEQHGPHLPVGTDFLTIESLARDAATKAANQIPVVVAPTLPRPRWSQRPTPAGGP